MILVVFLLGTACVGGWLFKRGWDARQPGAHPQPLPSRVFSLAPSEVVRIPTLPALVKPQPGSIQKSCTPARSVTAQVAIQSLCVYAPLVSTSVVDGALQIPADVHDVGLDRTSAALDASSGTTIIAGHVDDRDQGAGSFFYLRDVQPGAAVEVTDLAGRRTNWRVYATQVVVKSRLPTDIWKTTGQRRLVLVTCGGALLHTPRGNTYEDNLLVYATPAPSGP